MSLGLHTWEGHGRQQSLLFPWTLDGAYGLLKKSLAESFHSSGNEQFRFQREDSNPAREAKSGTPVTGKDHQEVLHCWTLSLLPVPPDQCSFQPPSQSASPFTIRICSVGCGGSLSERIHSYQVSHTGAGPAGKTTENNASFFWVVKGNIYTVWCKKDLKNHLHMTSLLSLDRDISVTVNISLGD